MQKRFLEDTIERDGVFSIDRHHGQTQTGAEATHGVPAKGIAVLLAGGATARLGMNTGADKEQRKFIVFSKLQRVLPFGFERVLMRVCEDEIFITRFETVCCGHCGGKVRQLEL